MLTNKTHTIHALAVLEKGGPLVPFTYEAKPCGAYDVEVKVLCCGICHSDLHLIDNDWGSTQYPLVPGHEVVGTIVAKGDKVAHLAIGDLVGIGWQSDSCHICEWCHSGEENLCAKQKATCVDQFGGFADRLIVNSQFAFPIPDHLDPTTAAPLLCGGATVYSPLAQYHVGSKDRVGILGIGGLGHLAIQFSKALGATTVVFSTSKDKEKEAKELGADHFINVHDEKEMQRHLASFDYLLATSSAPLNWEFYLSLLRPKGKLIMLGAPPENLSISLMSLIGGRKVIAGSNIAGSEEMMQMLHFAAEHQIKALVEIFPMDQAEEAFAKLRKNQIHYRAVLVR